MTANDTNTTRREVEQLIESLVDVGSAWARHGLTIGRTSLEASAKTLSRTAELLGTLSKKFEQPAAPANEAPAAS